MSKYLDRFIPAWEKSFSGTDGYENVSTWVDNKNTGFQHISKNLKSVFTEEEYKGFALIIVERPQEITKLIDDKGEPARRYLQREQFTEGEKYTISRFFAFAWRIGGFGDDHTELQWVSSLADLQGVCQSTSFDKTLKLARKQLDVYDRCYQVHDRLKEIADLRLGNEDPVINVLKDEEVYVSAHGRWRKGIVVATTGSRFIVSYVTPSNLIEIKTKTVHLRGIRKGRDYAVI
jgi:hypothetical protein